jgi:hypothetical protein
MQTTNAIRSKVDITFTSVARTDTAPELEELLPVRVPGRYQSRMIWRKEVCGTYCPFQMD